MFSSLTPNAVESYLKEISEPDGTIDLSTLKRIAGGGTHDIYRSDKSPDLLLKIIRKTIGDNNIKLTEQLQQLTEKYTALYQVFGESRCIIEKRSLQSIKTNSTDSPQQAIVSVVPFDPCFDSKEKCGFNVVPTEMDGVSVNLRRHLYMTVNRSLLGDSEESSTYVLINYPLLNKNFENIFKLLDTEPSMVIAMREFLTKYKSFYKKSDILLDTIGYDNVFFYKNNDGWQFKIASAIKHETGALVKKALQELINNPLIAGQSFESEYFTSIYFMPANIRALNACAKKVGMEKIIDDINFDDKTIEALSNMHMQKKKCYQAVGYADHDNFKKALELYNEYKPDEKSDDTEIRDTLGTWYWNFIKKGGKVNSQDEVKAYLNLLQDKRNKFPEHRESEVKEAIKGLEEKLSSINSKKLEEKSLKLSLPPSPKFFNSHSKNADESDKEFVARLTRMKRRS